MTQEQQIWKVIKHTEPDIIENENKINFLIQEIDQIRTVDFFFVKTLLFIGTFLFSILTGMSARLLF